MLPVDATESLRDSVLDVPAGLVEVTELARVEVAPGSDVDVDVLVAEEGAGVEEDELLWL
jgi:hypothetical protein